MEKFKEIKENIKLQLDKATYAGDLSDIGNEIGIVIGNYISDDEMGYELKCFYDGVNHGISLTKGTHG